MSRFEFISTPLPGVVSVQRKTLEDQRGFLSRFYCADEFRDIGVDKPIAQINHTLTRQKGAVRGLHFQYPPYSETKLVSCLKGEILSAENRKSLLIPEGYAHGFQALSEDCELIYLHTAAYRPGAEGALNVREPKLNIAWPLPITDISERDSNHSFISPDFQGIIL